jgi:hypothetical protein
MRKRTIALVVALAAALVVAAVPAMAQGTASTPERARPERMWPPEWVDKSLDELKAGVVERAENRIERVETSQRLDDEQKADRIAAIEGMLAAVNGADSNAEVAGLVISRVQLARQEIRAERRGITADYEGHLAGDLARAEQRMERLTKVAGWAGAAGEDVAEILDDLAAAEAALGEAIGGGALVARHDAAHVALAWMTKAAAGLDRL